MSTPTLVSTAGGASSNSYATVAEADAFHSARLHSSAWTAATSTTKTIALIMATRVLDEQMLWAEFPTGSTQALAWPRVGVLARDEIQFVGSDVVPQEIKNAVAELARQLIGADRTLDSDVETQGITRLAAGSVDMTFKESVTAKVIPDAVFYMFPSWWGRVRSRNLSQIDLSRS